MTSRILKMRERKDWGISLKQSNTSLASMRRVRKRSGCMSMRRVRPETVLIKPVEGVSYADVLKILKSKATLAKLGVEIKGVRETKKEEVLMEAGAETGSRTNKSTSAIGEAVGVEGNVCELIFLTEVERIDTTTENEEARETLKRHFGENTTGEVKVTLTKKAFRGSLFF